MTRFGQVVKDISESKLKGTLHLDKYKPMTKDKWDKLDEVLPSSQITHLDASHCALDDTSQARFIQLVKKSVQLMVLNLSDNVIGERIVDLMDCINDHPHLADLRINNALTTMGFYLLANKLVKNKALKSLSIAHGMNTFDINGMKTIMKGLEENTVLKTLNLSNGVMRNSIDEAWSSVGKMLAKNNTLEELNINGTNLRNQDMQILVAGMQRPQSALVHLRLKTCILWPLNACFDTLLKAIPQSQFIKIEGLDDGLSVYPGINPNEFVSALQKNQEKMQQPLILSHVVAANVVQNNNKKRRYSEVNNSSSRMFTTKQNTRRNSLTNANVSNSAQYAVKGCQ